jgi:asparagine synthase (glutamine-hydrolysing)
MSAISAILRFQGDASADLADLVRMHAAQRHRGRDGEGALAIDQDGRAYSFKQLPVPGELPHSPRMIAAMRWQRTGLPPTPAALPFASPDGRSFVILDGAIHNRRSLATELGQAGSAPRSDADAEVALEAFRRWGTFCFRKLDGIWAMLIVDLDRRVVIGSRDRIGVKPLYYAIDKDRLLLASEAWAIAQVIGGEIEPSRFFEFLSGFPPRSNRLSAFAGVHPVAAATWFEIDLAQSRRQPLNPQPYWDLATFHPRKSEPLISFAEAADRYRSLLTASIAAQSMGDVPVGSFLSGGFDTSTMVALWTEIAAQRGSQHPQTFSIAWDNPEMSERPYIEAVLAKTRADGKILELTAGDIWSSVDDVIKAQTQPLLGQDMIAEFHAYRFARQNGASIVLGGSGSDETQAGLAYYESRMVLERLSKLQLIALAKEIRGISAANDRSYLRVIHSYIWRQLRRKLREDSHRLPQQPWLRSEGLDRSDPHWAESFATEWGNDPSLLNRLLYHETRHTNMPASLLFSDRNAMAHAIEARFPYLDHHLVEFLFSMPAPYKVGFGRRKKLLFETARRYLPAAVTERKDRKFFVLLTNWMPLREHASALRDATRLTSWSNFPYVDGARMNLFVDDYLAGRHEDGYAVWRIFTASRWLDMLHLAAR